MMMTKSKDEDARQNERRRRIAEELIARDLRRRQRARADKALLDAGESYPDDMKDTPESDQHQPDKSPPDEK
jgi:hypothetical protein